MSGFTTNNRPTFVDNCLPQPGFGDHDTSILADILWHIKQKIKLTQRTIPCWNRADIDSIKEAIKSGMKDLVTSVTPVNELWIKLKNIITDSEQQYVPTKTTSKRFNQPWFNHECKVRKKVRRYRVFKRTNLPKDWLNFQQEAKTCRLTCNKVYNTYIKQNFAECDDYGSNKKFF